LRKEVRHDLSQYYNEVWKVGSEMLKEHNITCAFAASGIFSGILRHEKTD